MLPGAASAAVEEAAETQVGGGARVLVREWAEAPLAAAEAHVGGGARRPSRGAARGDAAAEDAGVAKGVASTTHPPSRSRRAGAAAGCSGPSERCERTGERAGAAAARGDSGVRSAGRRRASAPASTSQPALASQEWRTGLGEPLRFGLVGRDAGPERE